MLIDDGELLARFVRNRDSETFRQLMQGQMGFVYAAALRQSWNQTAAEDITQAVFVRRLYTSLIGLLRPRFWGGGEGVSGDA